MDHSASLKDLGETGNTTSNGVNSVGTVNAAGTGDVWQRRIGVPWERVDRAARAVLERAAAASRRRFADLGPSSGSAEAGLS